MILQFSFDVEDEYFGSFKDTSAWASPMLQEPN